MNMGYIRPMASNTSSLDGLDAHGATIDELAAIKNRDLYDLIKQAMGARAQPLLFVITTNGFVRGGIFDAQYQYACDILDGKANNPRFLPFLYELDDRAEWDNPECWEKANPGLGTIKSRQYLAEMVQKAKDDPSFKPTVLVKDFNMPQTSEAAWLRWEELDNTATFDLRFDYGIGGFDAADTTDLNAAKAICMRPDDPNIYVRSMYWIPRAVLEEAERAGSWRSGTTSPIPCGWSRAICAPARAGSATSTSSWSGSKSCGTTKGCICSTSDTTRGTSTTACSGSSRRSSGRIP